jgi:hypothetical protein
MKNVRRFQRVTLVGFVGINSIVYTEMKEFRFDEQMLFVSSVVFVAVVFVLIFSLIKKAGKKNKTVVN